VFDVIVLHFLVGDDWKVKANRKTDKKKMKICILSSLKKKKKKKEAENLYECCRALNLAIML